MGIIVVTGATGFIGRHLLKSYAAHGKSNVRFRALTRQAGKVDAGDPIEWVIGDIDDETVWGRLVEPGCTVINLAYAQVSATDSAIASMTALASKCAEIGVSRLIHCSTISVCGRTAGGVVDETTACHPVNAYGRQKLSVERALVEAVGDRFDLAIIRPTAVLGPGGENLRSLCRNLATGNRMANYLRSSLFGKRRMHLVPIENVVAAIRYLCDLPRPLKSEIFNVSADDDSLNNFRDVERILAEQLSVVGYRLPLLPLPRIMIKTLLRLLGRNEVDVDCLYSSEKLRQWGFVPPVDLERSLRQFACFYAGHDGLGASAK